MPAYHGERIAFAFSLEFFEDSKNVFGLAENGVREIKKQCDDIRM